MPSNLLPVAELARSAIDAKIGFEVIAAWFDLATRNAPPGSANGRHPDLGQSTITEYEARFGNANAKILVPITQILNRLAFNAAEKIIDAAGEPNDKQAVMMGRHTPRHEQIAEEWLTAIEPMPLIDLLRRNCSSWPSLNASYLMENLDFQHEFRSRRPCSAFPELMIFYREDKYYSTFQNLHLTDRRLQLRNAANEVVCFATVHNIHISRGTPLQLPDGDDHRYKYKSSGYYGGPLAETMGAHPAFRRQITSVKDEFEDFEDLMEGLSRTRADIESELDKDLNRDLNSLSTRGDIAVITHLETKPGLERRGYATALLKEALAILYQRNRLTLLAGGLRSPSFNLMPNTRSPQDLVDAIAPTLEPIKAFFESRQLVKQRPNGDGETITLMMPTPSYRKLQSQSGAWMEPPPWA